MTTEIVISLIGVFLVTAVMSRLIKISPKYERKPRKQTPWQQLDNGDDPTVDR